MQQIDQINPPRGINEDQLFEHFANSGAKITPPLTASQLLDLAKKTNQPISERAIGTMSFKALGATMLSYVCLDYFDYSKIHPCTLVVLNNLIMCSLLHKYNKTGRQALNALHKQDLCCLFGLNAIAGTFIPAFFAETISNYMQNSLSLIVLMGYLTSISSTCKLYYLRENLFQNPGIFAKLTLSNLGSMILSHLIINYVFEQKSLEISMFNLLNLAIIAAFTYLM